MTTQLAHIEPPPEAPEKDPTDRSIIIGLTCTLLFHLLLLWLSPNFAFDKFSGVHSGISVTSANKGKTFDFELEQPPVKEKPRDPFQFVETNSAAPENIPDKTNNFSNRNQQSAQEVAAKELDPENRPSTKGEDRFKDSTAIVSGNMAPPQIAPPPTPDTAKEEAQARNEQKARKEEIPLSGFDKTEGKSEDGIATNIANSKSVSTNADQLTEGTKDATDPTGGLVAVTQAMKQQPKERPRLSSISLNRQSPIGNRITGTRNVGVLGIDARWSEYGEYLNQLVEAVQIQFNQLTDSTRASLPHGVAIITFRINSKGETNIIKVEDQGVGRQGVLIGENAITLPQPYRKWTDQMVAVLGDSQELTFSFYYQ